MRVLSETRESMYKVWLCFPVYESRMETSVSRSSSSVMGLARINVDSFSFNFEASRRKTSLSCKVSKGLHNRSAIGAGEWHDVDVIIFVGCTRSVVTCFFGYGIGEFQ